MKNLLLLLLLVLFVPCLSFAGEKDVAVVDQPDELIVPLQAIQAQGEAEIDPYTRDDQRNFSGDIFGGSTQLLSLAGPDEERLIEQIIVSPLNDASVEILICVGGCETPFNDFYRLATVMEFQQLTFQRPIRAEQVRIQCLDWPVDEGECAVNVSVLMTPE